MKFVYGAAGLLVVSALAVPAQAAWSAEVPVTSRASSVQNEHFLFTLQAAKGKTSGANGERGPFQLILTGVGPVTKFSDRPFRNASYIGPAALRDNWQAWFAKTPPNAVLTFSSESESAPTSIVVTLTKPLYDARNRALSFTAVRIYRDANPDAGNASTLRPRTPARFVKASLFIDGSDPSPVSVPNDAATYGWFAGQTCQNIMFNVWSAQVDMTQAQISAAAEICPNLGEFG